MKKENIVFALAVFTIASFLLGIFAIIMFAPASQPTDITNQTPQTPAQPIEFIASGLTNATVVDTLDFLIVTCNSTNTTAALSNVPGIESVTPYTGNNYVVQIENGKKNSDLLGKMRKALQNECALTI